MDIRIKRIYAPPSRTDGARVLIDHIWPRGIRKSEARLALWLKEVAPSTSLRRWFGHRPERWREFRMRYLAELAKRPKVVEILCTLVRKRRVTLLYAAHNEKQNNAVALAGYLRKVARRKPIVRYSTIEGSEP